MVCDVKVLKPTLFVALIPASNFLKTRFFSPGSSRHHTNYEWLTRSRGRSVEEIWYLALRLLVSLIFQTSMNVQGLN